MSSTYLLLKIGFVGITISFSIFIMKMSLNVTDNAPPIVNPSTNLKNLLFIVNVTSVASFNNKRLKMSFGKTGLNFFLLYI